MGKTVITYGTFDMFHIGHLNLLRRLKEMGDRLIVAVSTDEFNQTKGKKAMIPYAQRSAIVQAIRYVDLVIPEESWEQKLTDIADHQIDIFAIGDDWQGKFDHLKELCEVHYLERTKDVSSSELKASLKRVLSISPEDLQMAFSVLEQLRRDLA
ncbi:MAG: glycerol-3-phosphate cytidylyltransferase [Spirochaetaceae bacterium]|nr:MAG: glycerol-3-phosphate cytidylyltransferase [Spirochaetaceae bacterium]